MIEGETHYEILGIEQDATPDKIHRAYTALLKEAQTIPDSEGLLAFMAKAKVAYQVLSHPESRTAYHRQMEMTEPQKRKWESASGQRDSDPAVATAIGVISFTTPIGLLIFLKQGLDLDRAILISLLDAVVWYIVVWGAMKWYYRFKRKMSSTTTAE